MKLTEKQFLQRFKKHCEMVRPFQTKLSITLWIEQRDCPFWDTPEKLFTRIIHTDAAQYFREHKFDIGKEDLIPKMLKVLREVKWNGKKI